MQIWRLAFVVVSAAGAAVAGPHTARTGEPGVLARPQATSSGTIAANSYGSALYLAGAEFRVLAEGPGVGTHFTVSIDGSRAGFKRIGRGQVPAEVDLRTGVERPLWHLAGRAGQPSYAADGTVAFTVDTTLIVLRGPDTLRVGLGTYANLCPLSPDARSAAFNSSDDQLWLVDIATGSRRRITDGRFGYVDPRWSPDGRRILYASLHGLLMVYDIESGRTVELGEGRGGSWSPDARRIAFYRVRINGMLLTGSDLYLVDAAGTGLRALTETADMLEMEPSFTPDGGGLLYHVRGERAVRGLDIRQTGSEAPGMTVSRADFSAAPPFRPIAPDPERSAVQDIPYVHQVYDTPDWFNGHWACAPTQAIMVLAHYGLLPPWETVCSWPTPHLTAWGAYVAEPYQFRQTSYTFTADAPSGSPGRGGYGYMWTGSWSPRTRMAEYFRRHGMTAEQTQSTPYATALAEITGGHPFSMCVMLTDAGHLVLAHGLGTEPHTLVFNDPYGDKNRGYVNYLGKDVRYDWPGYNNGYQNLNGVAWCIATRPPAPAPADTLVDDLAFTGGFSMQIPPSMMSWNDLNRGYAGHLWFAVTRPVADGDACAAEWRPRLPASGAYEVSAFIDLSNATRARYRITHAGGETVAEVDQKTHAGGWAPLGTYSFGAGQSGSVRLGDASDSAGQEIVFDAIRWVSAGPSSAVTSAEAIPQHSPLLQNYPNPFNPRTTLRYVLAGRARVRLEIVNVLGSTVAVLVEGERGEGTHSVEWDAARHPSGLYIARLRTGPGIGTVHDTRTLLLVR